MVTFLHAAGINPDVLQPIAGRESIAALDLCKSGFVPSGVFGDHHALR